MAEIELPWPPKQLLPNYKRSHHWSSYRRHEKSAEMLGFGLTVQALGLRSMQGREGDIHFQVIACPPKRPGPLPDDDNLVGALKNFRDGIARGLGVNDRQFRQGPIEWRPKEGTGKVIIRF